MTKLDARLNRRISIISALAILGIAGTGVRVSAAPSEQVPVGPRGIALGGAYTSLALDASALFWNPAGLSWIGHQELAGTYANLYQADLQDSYAAFILPISRKNAVGADWYHSGFKDAELAFGENRFDLSWAMQFDHRISAGVTAKYLTRDTDLDGALVSHGTGFGLDLGVLANPFYGFRIGAIAQDVFDTSINTDGNVSTIAYPRNIRVGASYDYRNLATIAFDVDDRWHAGAEVRPLEEIALRAGFEDDREGSEAATWTAGAGLRYGIFRFDYAYVMPPVLSATSHFGLSLAFNFNPALVRIEEVKSEEIFASFYKTYAHEPFGTVTVRNLSDKYLEGRFAIEIPELSDQPTVVDLHLPRAGTQTINLQANLSPKALEVRESSQKPMTLTASYKSDRLDRSDRTSSTVVVYPPGRIDWSRGVEQAAAFITVDDPIVDSVATRATHAAAALSGNPFAARNVANAAALFEAVNTLGVIYQPDPADPYKTISEQKAVDRINYPRETLEKRSGDCDDTSVLFAALLERVGIRTKLVAVPGHLFLMFDTGRHDRYALGVEDAFLVEDEGSLWIPLETTALSHGFTEAWQAGADKYAGSQAAQMLALVDVRTAQSKFEPSLPPAGHAMLKIDTADLTRRLNADATVFAGWQADYVRQNFPGANGDVQISADARDQVAHVHFESGRLEDALRELEGEAKAAPRSARVLNNLGNARVVGNDWAGADSAFRAALAIDSQDAGIWLNRGILLEAAHDSLAAERMTAQGISLSGGYDAASTLLRLGPEQPGTREGAPRLTQEQVRQLLRRSMKRLSPPGPGHGHPVPPVTPITTVTAGPRGSAFGDNADLRSFLYWRTHP